MFIRSELQSSCVGRSVRVYFPSPWSNPRTPDLHILAFACTSTSRTQRVMETPANTVTASLAFGLEGASSTKAAQKAFQAHLRRLAPLRPSASPSEIESFYIVAAWFSPYRFTPTVLAQHYGVAGDNTVVDSSRSITALTNLAHAWGSNAIAKVRRVLSTLLIRLD